MIDLADLLKADSGQSAHIIHLVDKGSYEGWLSAQPERVRAAINAQGFKAKANASAIVPGENDEDWAVLGGVADVGKLSTWCLAKLAEALPEGTYRLADTANPAPALLGWLLAQYEFARYRKKDEDAKGGRVLLTGAVAQIEAAMRLARATFLVRDLVNTPAADMGPAELETAAEDLAREHDATLVVTQGDTLEQHYPLIHAVGRAAGRSHAPRLIELGWGRPEHPCVAIIGKGVCFDSGGLDLKPSSAMRLMKKDMGGAAHALALAQLVMEHHLPVRLHVLIPAVENAVAGNAFRPGDVLTSRNSMTVEIGNTDAEGRLVLADAITKASEHTPELILDFATLTGAARVALGPDLPAMFANDDALAAGLTESGATVDDPVWRLPLWDGYEDMLKSDIADIANASESGFAGAITAALFLKKFVPEGVHWAHFDTFAWRQATKPGRPKGGDALSLRAAFALLYNRYPTA